MIGDFIPEDKDELKEKDSPEKKGEVIKPNKKDGLVRTYQDDISSFVKNNKTSLSDIYLSKSNSGFSLEDTSIRDKNRKILGISVILIIIAVFITGLIFIYQKSSSVSQNKTELKPISLVYKEYEKEIYIRNLNRSSISQEIGGQTNDISIPLNSIMNTYLTTGSTENKHIVDAVEFLVSLESRSSQKFLRFIENSLMLGTYSSQGNHKFIILKTKSFENLFPETLKWEADILSDLEPYFGKKNVPNLEFKDIVLQNKDIRAILDEEGKIMFGYSFPSKNYLLIADDRSTFIELFRRLSTGEVKN